MTEPTGPSRRSRIIMALIAGPVFVILGIVVFATEKSPWEPAGRTGMPAAALAVFLAGFGLFCLAWGLWAVTRRR